VPYSQNTPKEERGFTRTPSQAPQATEKEMVVLREAVASMRGGEIDPQSLRQLWGILDAISRRVSWGVLEVGRRLKRTAYEDHYVHEEAWFLRLHIGPPFPDNEKRQIEK